MAIEDELKDVQEAVINALITENGMTNTIANGQVGTAELAADAVTSTKIADDAVGNEHIQDNAVSNAQIADNSISEGKLIDGAVSGGKLAAGAVTDEKIANGSFSADKLLAGSVTETKIADDAVTATKIAGGAVTATKIADGAVTAAKLGNDVNVGDVDDGAVTPNKLSTGGPSWDTNSNLLISGSVTGDDNNGALVIYGGTNANGANIELYGGSHTSNANKIYHDADEHIFRDISLNETMRITSGGSLEVCTPSNFSKLKIKDHANNYGYGIEFFGKSGGTAFSPLLFRNDSGTSVGSVTHSTASTAYNTTSDYRLKEDVIDIEGSLDRLKALKPCNFRWISDGTRVDGFLAHEAQEVVPEAVTGTKDAVDPEGNPEYQGIDQSKLVPLLTKALQEAVLKIEALETRVAALEV